MMAIEDKCINDKKVNNIRTTTQKKRSSPTLICINFLYLTFTQAKKRLCLGEELDECFVAELLKEKLNSPRIKHYGN